MGVWRSQYSVCVRGWRTETRHSLKTEVKVDLHLLSSGRVYIELLSYLCEGAGL